MNRPGYFESLWMMLWSWIQNSMIYRLLRSVYDGISGAWRRSRITGWFRKEHDVAAFLQTSLIGRIFCAPFTFLSYLQKRFGAKLATGIQNSVILRLGRCYMHNVLALNLRFLGVLLLGLGAGLVFGGASPVLSLALFLAGAVCFLFDCNLIHWLEHSRLVQFVCRCLNLEPDFGWYDKAQTGGKGRLILAGLAGLICGFAGSMVSPLLGIAAPFGIAFMCLILARPIAGLYALVFAAPILPTMADAALAVLCLFALFIKRLCDAEYKIRFDGMSFLILLFLAIYLIAGITSFAMAKSLSIWVLYVVFIGAYFLTTSLIQNRKQLKQLLTVFVLSGFLVCLYGIAQYVFGWNVSQAWMDEEMFTDIKMRIYSTLDNPNVLGEYILLVLPVAIGLMWTSKKVLQKIIYGGISAVMFVALILTFSRGCWIGLLLAAVIFITFVAGKLWGLGLIALPILPAVLPESIVNRFTSIGDMKDSSTSYRVYIWMGTLAMVKDFWLSGIGMGAEAFKEVYPFYSYSGIVAPHSHNLFLQILVESGIGGILVFLLILVLFLKRMMVGYQYGGGKGHTLSVWITAISAGVCGFLIQGMFDNCFYNYRVLLVFWYVLGLAVAAARIAKNTAKEHSA